MTTDLENDLRRALHGEAVAAPVLTPEWPGPTLVPMIAPPRRGRVLATAAVVVLAVGAIGATLALRRTVEPAAHERPAFLRGEEVVLERTEPALRPPTGHTVKPGSLHGYRVAGHDAAIIVYDTALLDTFLRQARCLQDAGTIVCAGPPPVGGMTATDTALVSWLGLPSTVSYVQYEGADGTARWQIPIDGNVVLPLAVTPSTMPREFTAYDADGSVVLASPDAATSETPEPTPLVEDDPEREMAVVAAGQASLQECLARISARPLPDAAWDACVDEGAAAMVARNEELATGA